MSSDPRYNEIRTRITRRYDNLIEFFSHLVAYVVVAVLVFGVWRPEAGWGTLAQVVMGLWFMGLMIHAVQFVLKEARERAIEKAIERENQWRRANWVDADEQPAPRSVAHLSDDGELIDINDEPRSKRKRS